MIMKSTNLMQKISSPQPTYKVKYYQKKVKKKLKSKSIN